MTTPRESLRKKVLITLTFTIAFVFIVRLFYLQILSKEYSVYAVNNVVKRIIINPSRGILYDRNGKLFVTNQPNFSLYFVPQNLVIQTAKDTLLLGKLLGYEKQELQEVLKQGRKRSYYKPSLLKGYFSQEDFGKIAPYLWRFNGLDIHPEYARLYKVTHGSHFLGYINEVSKRELERDTTRFYQMGDLIGRRGIERYYEKYLRGKKGVKMVLEDVHGKIVGAFAEGKYDTLPVSGNNLMLSIDAELQAFGEKLMQNKIGAIVAIEPKTGEILASVSSPSYDPNLLTGANLRKNWKSLKKDKNKPLFNRAVQAAYPPGSIFKILNGLIAAQEKTMHPSRTVYGCIGGFPRNHGRPKCHNHPSPLSFIPAIQHSCNAFFAAVYADYLHHRKFKNIYEAFDKWYRYMQEFGIGKKLGTDLPYESKGLLPSTKLYDKYYGRKRWNAMTIISNSIGQGEVLLTPLQMANVAAIIANKGHYIVPHFVKAVQDKGIWRNFIFDTLYSSIDTSLFNYAIEGMDLVVKAGTGYWARIPDIEVCGKTGTAQNPHGEDHSVFIAFAPKDNPRIAIAVIVENAGFGGTWAAPIAALMIEKYLKGEISNQWQLERILNADFIHKQTQYVRKNH